MINVADYLGVESGRFFEIRGFYNKFVVVSNKLYRITKTYMHISHYNDDLESIKDLIKII